MNVLKMVESEINQKRKVIFKVKEREERDISRMNVRRGRQS